MARSEQDSIIKNMKKTILMIFLNLKKQCIVHIEVEKNLDSEN